MYIAEKITHNNLLMRLYFTLIVALIVLISACTKSSEVSPVNKLVLQSKMYDTGVVTSWYDSATAYYSYDSSGRLIGFNNYVVYYNSNTVISRDSFLYQFQYWNKSDEFPSRYNLVYRSSISSNNSYEGHLLGIIQDKIIDDTISGLRRRDDYTYGSNFIVRQPLNYNTEVSDSFYFNDESLIRHVQFVKNASVASVTQYSLSTIVNPFYAVKAVWLLRTPTLMSKYLPNAFTTVGSGNPSNINGTITYSIDNNQRLITQHSRSNRQNTKYYFYY